MIDITDDLPRHPTKRYKNRPASGIRQIIIHHSATKPTSPDGRADAEAFARYHVETLGWPGIGYDYVIGLGTVWKTNTNKAVNYHAGAANAKSLGICIVGDFDLGAVPAEQWEAAIRLTKQLMGAYDIPLRRVIGHREIPAPTSCPGQQFNMDRFRQEVSQR